MVCGNFGAKIRGILWSETKRTIWFDGQPAAKTALQSKVEVLLADGVAPAPIDADSQIFVVHGRDHDSRDQLELVLRRLVLLSHVSSEIRRAFEFAILLIRLDGEWWGKWSLGRNRVKGVFLNMSTA
jgi:hypothetical protein